MAWALTMVQNVSSTQVDVTCRGSGIHAQKALCSAQPLPVFLAESAQWRKPLQDVSLQLHPSLRDAIRCLPACTYLAHTLLQYTVLI